jgi:chemotaxis protein methyltransferase CheR
MDHDAIVALGRFDLIVCRNVLIYFSDETIQRVVGAFHEALTADGALLVGASESLLRLSTAFVCEEHRGAFLYRRAA